jgi:hypothetical protein
MHAPGTHFVYFGALTALLAVADTTRVAAQDDSASVAQTCIYRTGIDHTRVLDDRNILFFMHNRTKYRNTLLGTCPGLRAENHFIYGQDMANSLCKGNVINVLAYEFGSATRGASCWLGMFQPLSDDEVEELVAATTPAKKDKDANRRHAIKVEPVELPPAPPPAASVESSAPPPRPAEPAATETTR